MATKNTFLSSPFDNLLPEDAAQAAVLPGQQPVKPQELPSIEQPRQATADTRQPSTKAASLLPPPDYRPIFEAAAKEFDVPVNVLMALGHQESRFNPKAIGPETQWGRARGMMQYLDDTAKGLGINPFDPAQAIPAAARQIRERLDKGYSMEDAVKEHFAGPNRKLWGEKTAAYGREVMEKVGRIGEMLGAEPAAAPGDDLASLQKQLDQEEPGRYRVITPDMNRQALRAIENRDAEVIAQTGLGTPAKAPTQEEVDNRPLFARLGEGVARGYDNTVQSLSTARFAIGAGGDSGELAQALATKFAAEAGRKKTTGEQEIDAAFNRVTEAKGAWNTTVEGLKAIGAAVTNPKDLAVGIVEQVPNMLPSLGAAGAGAGVGAGAGAGVGALAGGVGAVPGAVTGAILGGRAGMMAGTTATELGAEVEQMVLERIQAEKKAPTAENIKALLDDKTFQSEARERGLKKGLTVAVVDQVFFGLTGKVASKAGAASTLGRKAALSTGAVGLDATGEVVGEAASQQVARGEVDAGDALREGVYGLGQSVVEPAISGAARAAQAAAGAVRPSQAPEARQTAPAAPTPEAPAPEAPAAPVAQPAAPQRSTAPGPLTRAVENAAEGAAPEQRVTVTAPEGQITGFVESYQQDGQGGFVARILGDDGQVYNFTSADQVTITPEAPKAGPLTAAVEAVAEAQPEPAAQPAAQAEPAAPVAAPTEAPAAAPVEAAAPAAPVEAPAAGTLTDEGAMPSAQPEAAPVLADMTEPELRERLKYVAGQARLNGGWDKTLTQARREIEREINKRTAQAQETSNAGADTTGAQVRDDGAASAEAPATAQSGEPAGRETAAQPDTGGAPAPEAALPGAGTAVSGADQAADTNAALKDPHAGKWFGSREKADAYLAKRKIAGTHEVVQTGKVRFEVMPKVEGARQTKNDIITERRVTYEGKPATLEIIRRKDDPANIDGARIKVDGERLPALNLGAQGPQTDDKFINGLIETEIINGDNQRADGQPNGAETLVGQQAGQQTEAAAQAPAQEEVTGITKAIQNAKRLLRETRNKIETEPAQTKERKAELKQREADLEREIRRLRQQAASEMDVVLDQAEQNSTNVEDAPQPTAGVEAQAPADQAPEAAAGDAAPAAGVPDEGSGYAVEAAGVEPAAAAPAEESAATPAELGRQAFAEGKDRAAPQNLSFNEKKQWFSGWDAANAAAPVSEQSRSEFSKNGVTITVAKIKGAENEYGVSYASTDIATANTKAEADAIAQRVLDSGAETIAAMREAAAESNVSKPAAAIDTTAQPVEAAARTDPFAGNKLFTSDRVAAARERLKKKLSGSQLNSGIDPELLMDGIIIAGGHIESGTRAFAAYAKAMIEDIGDEVKPYLLSFYEAARNYPGLDTEGMTPVDQAKAEFDKLIQPADLEKAQEAIGEITPKPAKRTKKTGAKTDMTLTQDWGVEQIDGYGDTYDRETGNDVKDAFLKEAKTYLNTVAGILAEQGFAPYTDAKGRPEKAVSVNESGVATSGDVTLTLAGPNGIGVYAHIGGTSLRGVVPTNASGVSLMVRVAQDGDKFGTKDRNRWMPVDLSAADLAGLMQKAVSEFKPKGAQDAGTLQTQPVPARDSGEAAPDAAAGDGNRQPVGAGLAGSRQGTAEGGQVRGGADGAGAGGTRSPEPAGQQPSGPARDSAGVRPDAGPADNAADFVIDADEIGKGGLTKKYRDNVSAIRILKTLEAEGRVATPDERKQLAKYVGWGAMKGPFDPENKQWAKQHAELKELLTPEEFRAARKSTLDAHYTSPVAIGAMNAALERLGYKGGRMLEPSVGVGNFLGLMPAGVRNASQIYGVELDSLTSRMVAALYPKAKIAKATGFEDFQIPAEFFDLVQGNPPFGSQPLVDAERSPYSGFSIHNYFLAKGIDKLRPGGLMQVVVSHNFLDAQDNRARKWINERASLIGAVRLPNTAFQENAGTQVVTDILIFQKNGGEFSIGLPDIVDNWVDVVEQVNTNPKTGESVTHKVSPVFVQKPNLVLGKPSAGGTMYSANEYTVEATGDIKPQLDAWVQTLPEGIYTPIERKPEAATEMAVPDGVKVGSYYVDASGEIMQRGDDVMGAKTANAWTAPNAKAAERMKGMIGLREALRAQMRLERSPDATEAEIEANRVTLNKLYDDFLKKHGHVNSQTNRRLFLDDTEAQLIQALEFDYDKGISKATAEKEGIEPREPSATKADIFQRRVAFPPQDFLTVTTAKDALLASLNYRGKVDPDYMAEVYGKPMDEIVKELGEVVFDDPQAGIVTADEYLSGDVKTKLAEAKAAAQSNPKYKRNVEALEKVIPADKKPSEITVSIGAAFVPAAIYEQFVKHISGGTATAAYIKATGQWVMDFKGGTEPALNTGKFGTDQLSAQELFQLSMLGRGAVVKKTVRNPDGSTTTVLMEKETEAAREKQNAIRAEWQSWLWSDPARADQIASIYNDKLNRIVERKYDGSHLSFPGMNPAISLLEHQKNGVWRGLQSYQVLYDHVVGAGKTFEMATLAMEMRRLGISRKPLFVVPNHLTLQWRSEFTRLYPGSNILAATPEDFSKDNRERLFSKIITGDWDAVVIGHSSLKKIGLPEETEKAVLQEQIDEVAQAIEDMKRARGDRNIIRDMEGIRSRLEAKMKEKLAAIGKRSKVVTFDELGIDAMFIDEMHEFKNLAYNSTMDRNPGMGNPAGSAKAFDLFVKTRWLFDTFGEKTPYITATGTPVSNSLVEMFNMQRYMQYPTLKRDGLHVFDAWAKQFGNVENVYEVAPSGSGYRQSTRFSKFANLPGLMSLYNSFADTITLDDLKAQEEAQGKRFPVPKMVGGKPQIVVAQRSPAVANLMGVPMAQTDEAGQIKFLADLNARIQIDQKPDTGKSVAKVGESYLGEFDTEQDARLKIVERALTPEVTVDPESILGRFGRLKQLTKETKGKVNALSLTGEANKAGLDYRLVNPAAPDFPGSKINLAVDNMVRIYKQWDADKGTQLVFCDLSIPLSARASYSSKARRLYVRDEAGAIDMKRGTMHTLEGQESLPYFVVQRGEKDLKRFDVYDAVSGAKIGGDFRTKQDAIDQSNTLLADENRRQRWIDRRETVGEISQEAIDEYNNENDIEADGIEAFTREDIAGVSGAAKFSVYDDIKAKLIAKGIPEREIAFIHDYGSPTAKDKLFKAVKSGEVRFLLGSTPKMGAGTNVQNRLVGLHHIDAPWRPSDLEQREGRIIRRGNELYARDPDGFEVFVGRYATEQTYDTRRWQILEHKARGIEQLRNFDGSMNEIDDIEGEAANAADMKAAASGDPLILEETRLKNDVRRLEQLQAAHADDVLSMNRKARAADDYAKTSGPRQLAEVQALADAAKKHKLDKDGFAPVTIDGKTFDTKEAAQEEIGRAMSVVRSGLREESVVLYRGIEFTLMRDGNVAFAESPTGTLGSWAGAEPFSTSGFVQRMKNYVDRLPAQIENIQAGIDKAQKDAVALREQAKAPFGQADELVAAREEYKRVQRALLAKGPAVPESQKPAVAAGIQAQKDKLEALGFGEALREFFAGQDETRFLRATRRSTGVPKVEAAAVVNAIAERWSNAPGVVVIESMQDPAVPPAVRLADQRQRKGGAKGEPKGFWYGGNAYIVSGSHDNNTDVIRTLFHEVLGHRGLRGTFGNGLDPILSQIIQARRPDVTKKANQYGLDMAKPEEALEAAEEVLADMAQEKPELGFVKRTIAAIRTWLRQNVPALKDMKLTDDEIIRSYILPARAYIEQGAQVGREMAVGRAMFSRADPVYSQAFKRWFGDSKVVDANGRPLVVYHGTRHSFDEFNREGRKGNDRLHYFTDDPAVASEYAGDVRYGAPNVMPVYVSLQKPFTFDAGGEQWGSLPLDIFPSEITRHFDERNILRGREGQVPRIGFTEVIRGAIKAGYDGVIANNIRDGGGPYGEQNPSKVVVAHRPEQIKSAIGNNGDFDPTNPDIRFSRKDADKLIEDADNALDDTGPVAKDDYIGRVVSDMSLGAKLVVHPRTVAAVHPEFTPVYRTAISQMETRDEIISDLGADVRAYDVLDQAGKEAVNKALELGRLTSAVYTAKQLRDGVTNTGERKVVVIGEDGKPQVATTPVKALLTQKGEVITLTDEQIAAYQGLRSMFDRALDMMRDQTLDELGFSELKGKPNAAQAIRELITDQTPADQAEKLANIARFVAEIEQAKRAGYVPFARYGDYVVTVKEKIANAEFEADGDGYIVRGLPDSFADEMLELSAVPTDDGWRILKDQKKAVERLTEKTVYSAKVETGLRDLIATRKAQTVEDIPAVRDAIEKARREWVGDDPARRIVAFKTREKKADQPVRLSDVDALAEVANIDNATWDWVRDQLADAIKAKGFRRHFFHSDNVPGYTGDFERSIADYVIGMAGYLSRRQHMKRWDNSVSAITEKPKLAEYAAKYRTYVNDPQEEMAMVRQIGFFAYIAGVMATAFVNLTQVPMLTVPTLTQVAPTALVLKETARAYKDALAMLSRPTRVGLDMFDPEKAPADVRGILKEAWAEGSFVPLETFDLMMTARQRNVGARRGVKAFNTTTQVVSMAFTFAERMNRLVTFIAAARLADKRAVQENAKRVLSGDALARQTTLGKNWNPKNFAEWVVDESQYRMGKANRPTMMRGVGSAIMQFKGFMLQTFEAWYRMAALHGKDGKLAALASLASVVALGGVWGLPGSDDLRKLIEAIYRQITDRDLDLKTELLAWVARTSGSNAIGQMVTKGASYPLGVDLTRVGLGSVVPDSPLAAAGIPFDMVVGRPKRAFEKASAGDYVGAAAEFTPNFAKNMIVAGGWRLDGVRDKRGSRLLTPDELTGADIGMRAIGFQPSIVTDVRDYEYAQRRQETAVDALKRSYTNKIAKVIGEMERTDDPAELKKLDERLGELYAEIDAHNAKADPEAVIQIGVRAIRNRVARELEGVKSTWGRERKGARGAAEDMRGLFGLQENQE